MTLPDELVAEMRQDAKARMSLIIESFGQATSNAQQCFTHNELALRLSISDADEFCDTWSRRLTSHPQASSLRSELEEHRLAQKASALLALSFVYRNEARLVETGEVLEEGIALFGADPNPLRAQMLDALANLRDCCGDNEAADELLVRTISEYAKLAGTATQLEVRQRYLSKAAGGWLERATLARKRGNRILALRHLREVATIAAGPDAPSSLRQKTELEYLKFELGAETSDEAFQRLHKDRRRLKDRSSSGDNSFEGRILLAGSWIRRNEAAHALNLVRGSLPPGRHPLGVRMGVAIAFAGAQRAAGNIGAAINTLEEALSDVRQIDGATPGALGRLLAMLAFYCLASALPEYSVRVEEILDELRDRDDSDMSAAILVQRAMHTILVAEYDGLDAAEGDFAEAERLATSEEQQLMVLVGRSHLCRARGKFREALHLTVIAVERIEALTRAGKNLITDARAQAKLSAALYERAAVLCADLLQVRESMFWAERGRAIQLRSHLIRQNLRLANSPAPFELEGRDIGIAYIFVNGSRTLIVGVAFKTDEAFAEFVDVGEAELQNLLPAGMLSEVWTAQIFAAVSAVESRLAPPLERLARRCATVYLAPDSRLFALPFAALKCSDGEPLIAKCALAIVPSISVLQHCHGNRIASSDKTCLAVGFDVAEGATDSPMNDFALQAAQISSLAWKSSSLLVGADAVKERVLQSASQWTVIHFAVHGKLDGMGQLSSSQVSLFDGKLSALDVAALDGQLRVDVVFLNACLSGRFQSALPDEVGGFPEAFMRAGAATLVAPLCHVEPEHASALAKAFHSLTLSGLLSKAEALRRAQLNTRSVYGDPRAWAAHVLFGDGE